MSGFSSISLVKSQGIKDAGINRKIQWFSYSLGLFTLRDREKSCYRIFVELLKASRKNRPLSSDELAYRLNLTRGTVVHHLNRLMDAGLVIHVSGRYSLRAQRLSDLVVDIRKDVCEMMDEVERVAGEIDRQI